MTKLSTKILGAAAVSLMVATPVFAGKTATTANAPTPAVVAAALQAATGASGLTVTVNGAGDYVVRSAGGAVLGTFSSQIVAYYLNAYN